TNTPEVPGPSSTLTFATDTPLATATVSPSPASTKAAETPSPTSDIPQSFVAFDADFSNDTCPLFEGDNDTRQYGCDLVEYFMLHKQPTTRYTFYDAQYTDAIVEAEGYLNKGTGKFEYGVVFRANTDGTLYYVFTVTND